MNTKEVNKEGPLNIAWFKVGSIPLSELKSTNVGLNQLQKSSSNHVISVILVSEFSFKNKHVTLQKVKSRKAEKISPYFNLNFSQSFNYQKNLCVRQF